MTRPSKTPRLLLRALALLSGAVLMLGLVAVVWSYELLYESRFRELLKSSFVRVGAAVCIVLYLCVCSSGGGAFIYFQF